MIEGLLSAGEGLDKSQLEALLANLTSRVFLMRNAQDDAPVLFRTRWALSYLRGPLTLPEIARLQASQPAEVAPSTACEPASIVPPASSQPSVGSGKPVIPAGVIEYHLRQSFSPSSSSLGPSSGSSSGAVTYAPRVLGVARMHFVNAAAGIDVWETRSYLAPVSDDGSRPDWASAEVTGDLKDRLDPGGSADARYIEAPAALLRADSYRAWKKQLEAYVYETAGLDIFRSPLTGAAAAPGGGEADFRARIALALREKRDAAVETLRRKYAPRLTTLEDQVRRAEERIERERSQLSQQKMQTAISVGTSILGALLGRRKLSVTNMGRAGTAARSAGRIGKESGDVSRAEESLEVLQQRKTDLENEFAQETSRLQGEFDPAATTIDRVQVKPRKSDIDVTQMALVWVG